MSRKTAGAAQKIVIASAMDELCKVTDFEHIHVGDVCKKSGVSRSTFYRYFEDIYEVPLWVERFTLALGVGEVGRTLTMKEGYSVSIRGCACFPSLMRRAGRVQGIRSIGEQGYRIHASYIIETLRDYKRIPLDDELYFQAHYASIAEADMLHRWLEGKIDAPADQFMEWLYAALPGRLRATLDVPVDPRPPRDADIKTILMMAAQDEGRYEMSPPALEDRIGEASEGVNAPSAALGVRGSGADPSVF
jgi:AcrR family transcriptional regulator